MVHRSILPEEDRSMVQNKFLKEVTSQFLFPLILAASGLGILVFWPFQL
jgi:hypothetical protein